MTKLSILIPTLSARKESFEKLVSNITSQAGYNTGAVEMLHIEDSGEMTIGEKRNKLVESSTGEFSCFIDDDDGVPPYYIDKILNGINENPTIDCIGFRGEFFNKGRRAGIFKHSVMYSEYLTARGPGGWMYYRPPNHLNPIRTELIRDFKFPLKNMCEDTDWAMSICRAGVLKKEHFVYPIMYYYYYNK